MARNAGQSAELCSQAKGAARGKAGGPSAAILTLALPLFVCSCSGSGSKAVTPITQPTVNGYVAIASAAIGPVGSMLTNRYTISHPNSTFLQENRSGETHDSGGGTFTVGANGFLSISLTIYNNLVAASPEVGNWALEIPGVIGLLYSSNPNAAGLVASSGPRGQGDTSNALSPLASNAACPSLPIATTYQYLTFTSPFYNGNDASATFSWNPQTDTAYGSVDVQTVGRVVNFTNITKYLLPGPGTTAFPAIQPGTSVLPLGQENVSGGCGTTVYGQVTTYPPNNQVFPDNVASFSISPDFLLENSQASTVLGAGFGAIGMAEPSSAVDTGKIVATNYVGFLSDAQQASNSTSNYGYFTTTAGFGPASAGSAACAAFQASLGTLAIQPSANTIYGGEFPGNNPAANPTANCDVAIDLGTQDAKNNGLYPNARIFIGSAYPANQPPSTGSTATPYSFPAVILAGQLGGQNAIFAIAADQYRSSAAPLTVGVYLLQAPGS